MKPTASRGQNTCWASCVSKDPARLPEQLCGGAGSSSSGSPWKVAVGSSTWVYFLGDAGGSSGFYDQPSVNVTLVRHLGEMSMC